MNLKETRIALVTGASSGFGLLTSIELARRGFRVIATLRDPSKATALHAAAKQAGVKIEVLALDVSKHESIAECAAAAGPVDVLVNNAGMGIAGFFEDTDDDEFRAIFETNLFGVAATTRAFLPGMRERRRGTIINVSSIGGTFGAPINVAYCASKFAVEGFSEALRHEVSPFGVHVALIEPGAFPTELARGNKRMTRRAHDPASPYRARTAALEKASDDMVARSKADPADVARAVAKAALARRPAMRYPVGADARAFTLLKWLLPFSWFERLLQRATGG